MGIPIVVRDGEGAGIVPKEDARIVTVRRRGGIVGGVYYRRIFGNDACELGGREDRERSG
jgi:hypothetical protein